MVKYQYEDDEVIDVWIQFNHCKKHVPFTLSETVTMDNIPIFIKAVVFPIFGISWMIQTREKFYFSVDEKFPRWCIGGPWYNTTICSNLHGPIFEVYFLTALQDRYKLMCGLHAYNNIHQQLSE